MLETRTDLEESGLLASVVGHVGDGNFHAIILLDRDNPAHMEKAKELSDRMTRRAIAAGGTCTGEHGIGCGKQTYLTWERGGAVPLMRQIKAALDPKGIMNPGKIFKS
jgi:D-lactate dehydrogenase (cytochrome)